MAEWNHTAQDPSIGHMGPIARDFYGAFGLGEDDKHIATVDADGVALAAIQRLHEPNQDLTTPQEVAIISVLVSAKRDSAQSK